MRELGSAICEAIIIEFGTRELLARLADPYFFQSLGCVLGYDWHSSGLTTTLTAALKEGLNLEEHGVALCGGKGKVAKRTPMEVEALGDKLTTRKVEELKRASKLAAKVDNVVLQDGFDLYHHVICFDERGNWVVIQQGMNVESRLARRYHWISFKVRSFVEEPHAAICSDVRQDYVLNLTSKLSREAREVSLDLVKEGNFTKYFRELKHSSQRTLDEILGNARYLRLPRNFPWNALKEAYELQPKSYEELLEVKGMGKSAIRALALVAKLIYGASIDWRDPVKYSFAHGGKDRVPYPIDKPNYERSIAVLREAIEGAKVGNKERLNMLRRLSALTKL